MQDTNPDDDFLNGKALAELLGISPMTLYRWEQDERLGFPKPSRVYDRKFWRRSEIFAWMAKRKVSPKKKWA